MRWMGFAVVALVLAGCGTRGSYQGRAVWSVTLDGVTQNTEQVDVHEVMPGTRSDLLVVSQDCDLPADARSGDELTIAATTCIHWRDAERMDLTFSGTGVLVGDDRLNLTLAGPITVVRDGTQHSGTFSYTFEGTRL